MPSSSRARSTEERCRTSLVVQTPSGPRLTDYVLVRPVTTSTALLELQQRVARTLSRPTYAGFDDGRWTPHVTLARRVRVDQVGPSLRALAGRPSELTTRVRQARRWDSEAERTWLLTTRAS